MSGPHIKEITSPIFSIGEEDIVNLNLVRIKGQIYPVYKDHMGYYIFLSNGIRVNNGESVDAQGL